MPVPFYPRYSYDAYGRVTATHTSANTSTPPVDATFGFTGDFYHAASGLNLTKYRAYDPNTGRWLSRDPLKNAERSQGPKLYEYVKDDPIAYVDPTGLQFVFEQVCNSKEDSECELFCALKGQQMASCGVIITYFVYFSDELHVHRNVTIACACRETPCRNLFAK